MVGGCGGCDMGGCGVFFFFFSLMLFVVAVDLASGGWR